jgi:DnaJ-class molecular chaperone
MPHLVRVTCPDCDGRSNDPREPYCGWCHSQGHLDIDRLPNTGDIPTHHPDGRLVVPWVDAYPFPEVTR